MHGVGEGVFEELDRVKRERDEARRLLARWLTMFEGEKVAADTRALLEGCPEGVEGK